MQAQPELVLDPFHLRSASRPECAESSFQLGPVVQRLTFHGVEILLKCIRSTYALLRVSMCKVNVEEKLTASGSVIGLLKSVRSFLKLALRVEGLPSVKLCPRDAFAVWLVSGALVLRANRACGKA